jgi:hypothetical protein
LASSIDRSPSIRSRTTWRRPSPSVFRARGYGLRLRAGDRRTSGTSTAPTTVTKGTNKASNSSAAETARKARIITRGPRPRSRARSPSESVSPRPGHVMTVRHRVASARRVEDRPPGGSRLAWSARDLAVPGGRAPGRAGSAGPGPLCVQGPRSITVRAPGRIETTIGVVPTTLPSVSTSRSGLVSIRTSRARARMT